MSSAEKHTIEVRIDGRPVRVPEGATVLEAARIAGVEIPTLCYLPELPPLTTCFVCIVRIRGRAEFAPACATRVEPGMEIDASSDEVRAARRTALELLLSDHRGECEAPCTLACPAGLDIAGMTQRLAAGDAPGAWRIVRQRLPLAGSIGRICPQYCERACRRGRVDDPVAIRSLHRYAFEAGARHASPPDLPPPTGRRILIVGAGVTGLSAAWFLALEGHKCTVVERRPEPGGLLRWAVPAFAAPPGVVRRECEAITAVGVELQCNRAVDWTRDLETLRHEYDAVLVAAGAVDASSEPDRSGADALDLLERIAGGEAPDVTGKNVVVVGPGDEAVAAARALARLGARPVRLLRGSERRSGTANRNALECASQEGVEVVENAAVASVQPTPEGGQRVNVKFATGAVENWECDFFVSAPVRARNEALLARLGIGPDALKAAQRTGWLSLDDGVFLAGECVAGAISAVHATAAGRNVATAIDRYLRGESEHAPVQQYYHRLINLTEDEWCELRKLSDPAPRVSEPCIPPDPASPFSECTADLSPQDARREAARCMQCACGVRKDCELRRLAAEYGCRQHTYRGAARSLERDDSHPILLWEPGKCILCGRCTAIAEAAGESPGLAVSGRGFTARVRVPFDRELREALSPETARRCAEVCPTGALTLRACE